MKFLRKWFGWRSRTKNQTPTPVKNLPNIDDVQVVLHGWNSSENAVYSRQVVTTPQRSHSFGPSTPRTNLSRRTSFADGEQLQQQQQQQLLQSSSPIDGRVSPTFRPTTTKESPNGKRTVQPINQRRSSKPKVGAFNISLLGSPASGKTALVRRLIYRLVEGSYTPTGQELHTIVLPVDDQFCVLRILDQGGSQKINPPMIQETIAGADALIFVFSLADASSFSYIKQLIDCIDIYRFTALALVGMNADKKKHRAVSSDQGEELATSIGAIYLESSVLTPRCTSIFYTLARQLVHPNYTSHRLSKLLQLSATSDMAKTNGVTASMTTDASNTNDKQLIGSRNGSENSSYLGGVSECSSLSGDITIITSHDS